MLIHNIFFCFSLALALPQNAGVDNKACKNPRIRKEWRKLTDQERTNYLDAVECLYKAPAKGADLFPAAQTRHDDYSALHINRTTAPDGLTNSTNRGLVGPGIHFNGVFLPWHRYLIWNFENTLRDECGYNGTQPYWDWSKDTPEYNSSFEKSPVFFDDAFGGNGPDPVVPSPPRAPIEGGCITTSRFAQVQNSVGPGYNLTEPHPHCIQRNFQVDLANGALQWELNVWPLLRMTNFTNFTLSFDTDAGGVGTINGFGVHGGGHGGTGGEQANVWSSINDPIFFMHHAQLDRIWWVWQTYKPENLHKFGGPIYPNGTGQMTLDYPVEMSEVVAPAVPIRKVMDTLNRDGQGILCYEYEDNGETLPN
ncbi:Di-copper centre-containing protein [Microthyrium microscopicum]|uniref:Di-copper centre-containing protein n=1 Tax=Microthyrium microscopicum TaxID=703497 RepID=A0A6A6TZQ7_9PEZI|nr:Di-copper centre-containing protein [Microthyrium microscopicum]